VPKPTKPQIRVDITEEKDRLLKAIAGIKDSSVNAILIGNPSGFNRLANACAQSAKYGVYYWCEKLHRLPLISSCRVARSPAVHYLGNLLLNFRQIPAIGILSNECAAGAAGVSLLSKNKIMLFVATIHLSEFWVNL
jgi:hypothetical protein